MAKHRPKVPTPVKAALRAESGGSCSNPGCPNVVVEMHHIKEWAVYQAHSAEDMICLCPTCHDSVDRGALLLTDDLLYEWKKQAPGECWGGIQAPPADMNKLLVGSVSVVSDDPFAVFDMGTAQSLAVHLDDTGRLLNINADVYDLKGSHLLGVRNNTTTHIAASVHLDQRPGKFRVTAKGWQSLMPLWAYTQLARGNPQTVLRQPAVFDLEVVKKGVVRAQGIWSTKKAAVIITSDALLFFTNPMARTGVALTGESEATILNIQGPGVLFAIGGLAEGRLQM